MLDLGRSPSGRPAALALRLRNDTLDAGRFTGAAAGTIQTLPTRSESAGPTRRHSRRSAPRSRARRRLHRPHPTPAAPFAHGWDRPPPVPAGGSLPRQPAHGTGRLEPGPSRRKVCCDVKTVDSRSGPAAPVTRPWFARTRARGLYESGARRPALPASRGHAFSPFIPVTETSLDRQKQRRVRLRGRSSTSSEGAPDPIRGERNAGSMRRPIINSGDQH
jgi:hypothetical protein